MVNEIRTNAHTPFTKFVDNFGVFKVSNAKRNSCTQVFVAGHECMTPAFRNTSHRVLMVFQRYSKHRSCHLQVWCLGIGSA
jgi:hypothetical protein